MGINQSSQSQATSSYNQEYYSNSTSLGDKDELHNLVTTKNRRKKRRELVNKLDKEYKLNQKQEENIKKIQSYLKAYNTRKNITKNESASIIQACLKRKQASLYVNNRLECIDKLNACYNGYKTRAHINNKKQSIDTINSYLKGLLERQQATYVTENMAGIRGIYERREYKNTLFTYFNVWRNGVEEKYKNILINLLQVKSNKSQLLQELDNQISNNRKKNEYRQLLTHLLQTKLNKTQMLNELENFLKNNSLCENEESPEKVSIKTNLWSKLEHERVINGYNEEERYFNLQKYFNNWSLFLNNKITLSIFFDNWYNKVDWCNIYMSDYKYIESKLKYNFNIWRNCTKNNSYDSYDDSNESNESNNSNDRRRSILQLQVANTIYIYNSLFYYFKQWSTKIIFNKNNNKRRPMIFAP